MFFDKLNKASGSLTNKTHPQNSTSFANTTYSTTKVLKKVSASSSSSKADANKHGSPQLKPTPNKHTRPDQFSRRSSEPLPSSKKKKLSLISKDKRTRNGRSTTAGVELTPSIAGDGDVNDANDANDANVVNDANKANKTNDADDADKANNTNDANKANDTNDGHINSSKPSRKRRTAKSYNIRISDESSSEEENWELNLKKPSSTSITATQTPSSDYENFNGQINRHFYLDSKELQNEKVDIISSSELVKSTTKTVKYKPLFNTLKNITLQLPFGSEEYSIVIPSKSEETNPVDEIIAIFEMVASTFVPRDLEDFEEKHTQSVEPDSVHSRSVTPATTSSTPLSPSWTIKHPSNQDCILRRLRRSIKNNDPTSFYKSIDEFNELILKLRESGEIASTISSIDILPTPTVYELLNQVYRRVVSPRTNELRDYKAFSSNVYGELLPRFVTEIFKQTKLTPSSVFVDLGSGVGNCVLQAALEIGCESWGCEMMKTASELATTQKIEFENRVKKLYRLSIGDINVVSADFVQDEQIHSALGRADVLLVNNYAFDAKLNGKLVDMFLDLKDGCKIVSLRSFVPTGHVITQHNRESPINILRVEKRHFSNDSVSWTTAGGDYYIATVDRSRLTV